MSAMSTALSPDTWSDNSFLYKVWRRREAQLMRLLTVRNLAQTRQAFEEEKSGLTLARFMQIMLKLLGLWAINRDELIIQLLDLFCCIDVNNDGVRGRRGLLPRCPFLLPRASFSAPFFTHNSPAPPPFFSFCRRSNGTSCSSTW